MPIIFFKSILRRCNSQHSIKPMMPIILNYSLLNQGRMLTQQPYKHITFGGHMIPQTNPDKWKKVKEQSEAKDKEVKDDAVTAAARKFYPDLKDFVKENKVNAEVIDMGVPMTTALAAAEKLKTHVANIFKSVFLSFSKTKSAREYALVVLPGDARIDFKKVSQLLGWNPQKVKHADKEIVLKLTGFPAGGTPPIGHKESFPVIVDKALLDFKEGYGGGGQHELLLKITPQEIIRVTNAQVAEVHEGRYEAPKDDGAAADAPKVTVLAQQVARLVV